MEVLSFIVSDKIIVEYFHSFIKSYDQLRLDCSDNDTEYYINPSTGKNEIYFHLNATNIEEEFNYNYTKEEQKEIKNYFGDVSLLIFEIQFKNETILNTLLNRFHTYLLNKGNNLIEKVLLSYPDSSLIQLENVSI
jgi:hypothetical protein